MSKLSTFPVGAFKDAMRSLLKQTDEAARGSLNKKLNEAFSVARKRWANGDEAGAMKILDNIKGSAKPAAAKKAAPKKAAKAAAKTAESKTPRLDKIAEGAKPMDEAIREESKVGALEAMADGAEMTPQQRRLAEARKRGAENPMDEGARPEEEVREFEDTTNRLRGGKRMSAEERRTVAENASRRLGGAEKGAKRIREKVNAREGEETISEATQDAIARREQKKIISKATEDLSQFKYSGKEKRAIFQQNKRRMNKGQKRMTEEETEAFIREFRNPTSGVRTFSSMPKVEEKNLPTPKPRPEPTRSVEETKAENAMISRLNAARKSRGEKPLTKTERQKAIQKMRQDKFLDSGKRAAPTRRKRAQAQAPTKPMSPAVRDRVRSMGGRARARGMDKSAMKDGNFKKFVAGLSPRDRDELMKDWLDGWHSA